MIRIISIFVVATIAAGCAPTQFSVTYQSFPAGAVITESGRVWGRAPVELQYKNPSRLRQSVIQGATCTWDSGTTVATGRVSVDLTAGDRFVVSCHRPQSAPGLEKDIAVSDGVNQQIRNQQQLDLQRRQTESAEGIFMIQGLQYFNELSK